MDGSEDEYDQQIMAAMVQSATEALTIRIRRLEEGEAQHIKQLKIKAKRIAIVTEEAHKLKSKVKATEARIVEIDSHHNTIVFNLEQRLESAKVDYAELLSTSEATEASFSQKDTELRDLAGEHQNKLRENEFISKQLLEAKVQQAEEESKIQNYEETLNEIFKGHSNNVAELENAHAFQLAAKNKKITTLESELAAQLGLAEAACVAKAEFEASHSATVQEKNNTIQTLEDKIAQQLVRLEEAMALVKTVGDKAKLLFGVQSYAAEIAGDWKNSTSGAIDSDDSLRPLQDYSPQVVSEALGKRWKLLADREADPSLKLELAKLTGQLDEVIKVENTAGYKEMLAREAGENGLVARPAWYANRLTVVLHLRDQVNKIRVSTAQAISITSTPDATDSHAVAWAKHTQFTKSLSSELDMLIAQAVTQQQLIFINHQEDAYVLEQAETKYTTIIDALQSLLDAKQSSISALTAELEEMTSREAELSSKATEGVAEVIKLSEERDAHFIRIQDLVAEVAERQKDHSYLLKSILNSAVSDGSVTVINKMFLQANKVEERDRIPVNDTLGFYCLSTKDSHGWSLLHKAVDGNHIKVVEVLLNMGLDVNATTNTGDTPLHLAVSHEHTDMVKILVKRGANMSASKEKKDQRTALHIAARRGHEGLVDVLLDEGANVHAEAMAMRTPLHMGVIGGHRSIVTTLLGRGADVNACDFQKWTPLHFAADLGDVAMTTLLLDQGANIYAKATGGATALHLAAERGMMDVVRHLVSRSALVGAKDDTGSTAQDWAANENHVDVVSYLAGHTIPASPVLTMPGSSRLFSWS